MKIYIGAKASRQISEESWEVYHPMKDFPDTATLKEVADWLKKYHTSWDITFTGFIENETETPKP